MAASVAGPMIAPLPPARSWPMVRGAEELTDGASVARRGDSSMTPALIVIDIQNDYFTGGRMELVGSDEASAQAHKLLDHFRATARPTFHIQHISLSKTATFFLPDSEGA